MKTVNKRLENSKISDLQGYNLKFFSQNITIQNYNGGVFFFLNDHQGNSQGYIFSNIVFRMIHDIFKHFTRSIKAI